MKRMRSGKSSFVSCQHGISLLEVLVALAIFGVIAVVFINGMITGNQGLEVSQERVAAESLAKSQVESIKNEDYISVLNYGGANRYTVIEVPDHLASAGYTIEINNPEIAVVDGDNMTAGRAGFELQSISTVIKRNGSVKLTITSYRVGLAL
jgi:prepilin-type N-terminal cleavage/methylation domain-containing protein